MPRPRGSSTLSNTTRSSVNTHADPPPQELSSLYDYLLKIILVGPSASGKSSLLHRLSHPVPTAPLPLTSLASTANGPAQTAPTLPYIPQTILLDLRTHYLRLGTPPQTTRLKLQLWDTAGTERFRAVSRSYYRASCAALVLYDISRRESLVEAGKYVRDVRAMAGEQCTIILVGNKADVDDERLGVMHVVKRQASFMVGSLASKPSEETLRPGSTGTGASGESDEDEAPAREVTLEQADTFARAHGINVMLEVSARTGEGVDALFRKVAGMVLAKVEMGEIEPDDPRSGVHYGDLGWGSTEGLDEGLGSVRRQGIIGLGSLGLGASAEGGSAGCSC